MNEFYYYGFIYLTTNMINGKKYIGQHSIFTKNGELRKANHTYLGSGVLLKKAIKKYGKENFTREILCFAKDKEELDLLEKEFIKNHNAIKNKDYYNVAEGGEGNTIIGFSEEEYEEYCRKQREKWNDEEFRNRSIENMKKSWTDERKQRTSESLKQNYKDNPQRREITSKSNIETWQNEDTRKKRIENSSKKIIQLDLDGNYIAEFINSRLACESLGIESEGSLIRRVCRKERITAYGYKWMFKSDYEKLNKNV